MTMKANFVECRLVPLPGGDRAGAPGVSLPAGPWAVIPAGDSGLRLVSPGAPAAGGALWLEPVQQRAHPLRVLAVSASAGTLRVNGQPAPRVTVLRENDFVQWGPEVAFTVEFVRRSSVGPPPREFVGRPCPVCRVPFAADVVTFGCACGTRLHCEVGENGLQCAQRSRRCPSCLNPLALEAIRAALPG